MSSNIEEAYSLLNEGKYILPTFLSSYNSHKILEVLGLNARSCHICSYILDDTCNNYNNYLLCVKCFNHVQTCVNQPQSFISYDSKIIKFEDTWLSSNGFYKQ